MNSMAPEMIAFDEERRLGYKESHKRLTHLTAEHGRLCDMPLTPSMLTIKSPKSLCATRNGDYVFNHTPHAPPHNSHLTPHTSHATRHTTHVTRHTPHATRHTSHATRHTSRATHHTPHATRHTSLKTWLDVYARRGHEGADKPAAEAREGAAAGHRQGAAAMAGAHSLNVPAATAERALSSRRRQWCRL